VIAGYRGGDWAKAPGDIAVQSQTVRRQRKSAMDKLGAHTIAHAVARAVSLGAIEPPLH
jgi:FixJ family two-component response regulator